MLFYSVIPIGRGVRGKNFNIMGRGFKIKGK
jgi:hypothetical protein